MPLRPTRADAFARLDRTVRRVKEKRTAGPLKSTAGIASGHARIVAGAPCRRPADQAFDGPAAQLVLPLLHFLRSWRRSSRGLRAALSSGLDGCSGGTGGAALRRRPPPPW